MSEPYRLELKIPYLPPMNTAATRRHRMKLAREVAQIRENVVMLTQGRRPKEPLTRARIICERHSGSQRPDEENLAISFKAWIDALCKSEQKKTGYIQRADVLVDDKPKTLHRTYRWFPAPPNKGFIKIMVEEIEG
jgi:hypothetical protein